MTRRTKGEGSAYMRKDGRAAASATYEGKRITKYGKTKTEAMQKLNVYLADLRSGKVVIGPKQTVEQYLTHWLEDVHRLEIELTTLDRYRTILNVHLIPALGHLQLGQLTREKVQSFISGKLDGGLSAGRVHFIHAVLSSALSHAVLNSILAQNVCERVVVPQRKRKRHRVLSKGQCKSLIDAARGRRLWFLVLLAVTTGARMGELLALHWSDIDLDNMRVHIHRSVARVQGKGLLEKQPKTDSGSRRVVLSQAVVEAIPEQRAYIESARRRTSKWNERGLIFPNRSGSYMQAGIVLDELKVLLSEAGIPEMTFHELRHSAATLLFAAGVNPKVVQETLGHSNISITLGMYGDVTPDMQQQVAIVMDKIFD